MNQILKLSKQFSSSNIQQQKQSIKVSEFLSIAIQLSLESCKIIDNVQTKDNKNTTMKGIDDPATLADTKSQALIMNGFKNFWPNLTLIGEEDEEYKGEIEFDINSLNKQMIMPSIFKDLQQNQEFDINKAIVWIDPLDGTLSYVNNELDCVTNLIGLTYEEKPLMGIIAQPFQMQEDGSYIYCPKIYFSHVYQNIVYKIDMKNTQMEDYAIQINPSIHKPQDHIDNQIIVGTSKNHICSNKLQLVKNLNPDKILQYGGAGKKWIDVIEGTVDYSIYIGQGTKKWDIAAGDAIIHSLGGTLTSNSGNSYVYTNQKQNFQNKDGVLATLNLNLLKKILPQTSKIQN